MWTIDTVCIASSFPYRPKLIAHRSLEGIEQRTRELQGKGGVARVLDKTQDSQKIAKLVEDLRQALIIYQVCTTRNVGIGLS
jgi:hypothetical protein